MATESIRQLSDRELLEVTARVAADERRSTVELVELLSEVDARRLYLGQGCSSLFTYCTEVLRLSESAAYHRIEGARAIRAFPLIAERLREGSMTLTTVCLLRPHLTLRNHVQVLAEARHKSKREVEQQIARLAPKPEVAALVRRLPETNATPALGEIPIADGARIDFDKPARPCGSEPAAVEPEPVAVVPGLPIGRSPQPKVEPLASNRYLLRLSLSAIGHENLRRAQGMMRHSLPSGDLASVVERALELLVEHLERRKFAATAQRRTLPSKASARSPGRASASRYLPASVRRAVWKRDAGRCAFIGPHGRCTETGRLEFHHLVPFARGGSASPGNIALRCRAHNAYEGELCFGRREAGE
jgi:hypothetical protein